MDKKIAVLTANMGEFDKKMIYTEQDLDHDFFNFNDETFIPRNNAMTPRLQARIPKIFSWQLIPGYDYYVWIDSSCVLARSDSLRWLVDKCENVDMVLFKHPHRSTIKEEANYLQKRLDKKCPYITPRYENEHLHEEMSEILEDENFVDDNLFATTVYVYKDSEKMRKLQKEWWYYTSRYHTNEQLSLPYVLSKSDCKTEIIQDNYLITPYLEYVRNKQS